VKFTRRKLTEKNQTVAVERLFPGGAAKLPVKPDDVLPDSTSPYGPCPRCGRLSNFTPQANGPVTYNDSGYVEGPGGGVQRLYDEQLSILECQGCRQNVVVIEEQYVGGRRKRDGGNSGTVEWRGIHWWPTPGMRPANPDVPATVGDAIAEGTRCLAVQAPRAAAVMFRGAVGQIVTERGSANAQNKRDLYSQLKQMADDGDLIPTLAEWAHQIRILGNAGAHPNELDPVTLEEAEDLARLIGALVEYLYVTPAKVQRARNRRP